MDLIKSERDTKREEGEQERENIKQNLNNAFVL